MSKVKLIFIRAFLLVACLFYSNTIKAYDFEVDGLCYNKLSNNQVEITYRVLYDGGYSGNLMIPEEVKYGGIVYDVVAIGNLAFYNCKKLTGTLTIPSSITSIGYNAFTNCEGFTGSLVIPNSVISIGGQAFMGCKGLNGSLILPNSISSIEKETFTKCSGLKGTLKIPSKVRSIGRLAFGDCSGLTGSLTIPSSVTTIDEWAFFGCGFTGSLTIPNSVTSIGPCAFYYCKLLTLVQSYIENPFIIDNNVFESISSSAKLVVPKGTKSKYQALSGWTSHFKEIVEFGDASTYTLSITASGSGSASYSGATVRNKTSSFTVNEGASATITFTPDNGYKIKSVKVNNSNVTVSNNQYTISSINANTTIIVEFEAIPPTIYTLSITASGNGSASYSGTTIRGKTSSYAVNEGTSATITFTPDNGYRIKSVKVNNSNVTVSNNQYTISSINANTTVSVEFEAIPPTTYTLSITASGNGSASYDGTTIRSKTSNFTVNEGTSAKITFAPDDGCQIKTVKVNGSIISISNNEYTISGISKNITVEVEFENVPGDSEEGYNTYLTCINKTASMISAGSSIQKTVGFEIMNSGNKSIYITQLIAKDPDTKTTLLTSTDTSVLGELEGGKTKVLSIKLYQDVWPIYEIAYTYENKEYTYDNTQYEVLSVIGNKYGCVRFLAASVGENLGIFSVKSGDDATLEFVPGEGCVLSKVMINDIDITSSIVDNKYSIRDITSSMSVNAVFDGVSGNSKSINGHEYVDLGLPSGRYWSTANYGAKKPEDAGAYLSRDDLGYVSNVWGDYWRLPTKVEMQELMKECKWTWTEQNGTKGFDIKGPNGNTMFLPAAGMSNGSTISFVGTNAYYYTSDIEGSWDYWMLEGNSSEINISTKSALIDRFPVRPISTVKNESVFSTGGLNFSVISSNEKTANLAKGNYGKVLEVPATVKYPSTEWKIVGIDKGALSECDSLAAVIWNPDVAFTENVDNPNMLLYVKSTSYAPSSIKNVVVNGAASSIVLSDVLGKNDFYCPKEFTAQKVSYMHHYMMETGIGNARGWETIALPFDVQKITHQSKGEIVPFANWKSGDAKKPFWLMTYGSSGWVEANSIKANTPYIISMPNHSNYKSEFQLNGNVTFSAENVTIPTSDNLLTSNYNGRTFSPNYANQSDNSYYALNVNNDYVTYSGSDMEGSKFLIGLRTVHPFEAYMTSASQARMYIAIDEDMTTGIGDITEIMANEKVVRVYNLNGQLIMEEESKSVDEIKPLLSAGVYIVNGKKLIIK